MTRILTLMVAAAFVLLGPAVRALEQSAVPTHFPIPWGNSAGTPYINNIPEASQIGITNCAASLTDGFPPLTFVPASAGGCPPFGKDFNGILRQITQWSRWQGAGAVPLYNASFSSSIGGYPSGTTLANASVPGCFWVSTVDNNASNPDAGGANWNFSCPGGGFGGTSTGTANAQVVSATPIVLLTGARVEFTPGVTNTSGTTLNVNGTGAVAVRRLTPIGLAVLSGGEFVQNVRATVVYDGTFWVIQSQVFPVGTWAGTAGGTANAITLTVTGADEFSDLTGVPISFSASAANTGATTINVNGFGTTAVVKTVLTGTGALTGCEIGTGQVATVISNGTAFVLVALAQAKVPTRQILASGTSATYTTPACTRQLRVRMIGGGGAGGGLGSVGGTGGTTSFSSFTAIGGSGGSQASVSGSAGGLGGFGGSGVQRFQGSSGSSASSAAAGSSIAGGNGGAGLFGTGAGRGGIAVTPGPGAANSGAGGGGATNNVTGAGGGGGGEYSEFSIDSPGASYVYTVGAGGTAASGGGSPVAGGSGIIIVDEIY